MMETIERFWSKVRKTDSCWEWTSAINTTGYGVFHIDGKVKYAHRLALEFEGISIPKGMEVDHLCRNTKCLRPSHLEVVTPHENNMRSGSVASINAKKKFCSNGHPFDKENTYNRPDGKGKFCRRCHRESKRAVIATITSPCKWCTSEFTYRKVRRTRLFCGRKCAQKSSMDSYNKRQTERMRKLRGANG